MGDSASSRESASRDVRGGEESYWHMQGAQGEFILTSGPSAIKILDCRARRTLKPSLIHSPTESHQGLSGGPWDKLLFIHSTSSEYLLYSKNKINLTWTLPSKAV